MEEEAEKLKEMQKQVEESIMSPTAGQPSCKKLSCTSQGCLAHLLVKMVLVKIIIRNMYFEGDNLVPYPGL